MLLQPCRPAWWSLWFGLRTFLSSAPAKSQGPADGLFLAGVVPEAAAAGTNPAHWTAAGRQAAGSSFQDARTRRLDDAQPFGCIRPSWPVTAYRSSLTLRIPRTCYRYRAQQAASPLNFPSSSCLPGVRLPASLSPLGLGVEVWARTGPGPATAVAAAALYAPLGGARIIFGVSVCLSVYLSAWLASLDICLFHLSGLASYFLFISPFSLFQESWVGAKTPLVSWCVVVV